MAGRNGAYQPGNGDRERMQRADRNASIVLGAAVVTMGLLAGLFYAFDVAVMPGLTAADDRTLVDAMQQMIVRIENPAFYLTLFGAPALATIALVQARRCGATRTAGWVIAALAFYTVTVGVTFTFHFPLNYELTDAGEPARIENLAAVRDDFVTPWIAWNIVRTLASTAALGCLAWALVLRAHLVRAEQPQRVGPPQPTTPVWGQASQWSQRSGS